MSKKCKSWLGTGIIFAVIVGLFIVIQAVSGLYPFGDTSNLLWDEDIQYVDYFAFYRDVLLGKAGIGYSFSKSAGGSLIALFGYYLGCPLNLLVVFFRNEQLPMFLFWLTAVKLGLAGVTFSVFVKRRFTGLSEEMAGMLSVAYGFMQYNMLQLSNIMWLDGVILLPLLLLAVYEFIRNNKKSGLFLAVFFSVAINWYTGYMTGLFAVCYYFYERILKVPQLNKKEMKGFLADTIRCGLVMFAGLLGSCFIFYPVFAGLQKGKQAFNPEIFQFATYDSFIDVFQGFALGSIVPTVSLYCGLLFLGFFFYFFCSRDIEKKEKIVSLLAAGFMFASCWLVPLDCIWSGMRYAGTYRFRYSFIVIFLVLYLGARGAQVYEKRRNGKMMACIFVGCILMILFFQNRRPYEKLNFYATLCFLGVYTALFLLAGKRKILARILTVFLALELVLNGVLTFSFNYRENQGIDVYLDYAAQSEKQIEQIKEREQAEFYRMDTLEKRSDAGNGCSAYLNEAMAYGYSGLAHYSSTFDTDLSRLIYDLGYSTLLDLSVVQESILPSDSLFGIKYLLSKKEVTGYEKVEEIPEYNGKSVYYNPYALGLGVEADAKVLESIENADPFAFQNQLFSNILGRDVEIFRKAEPTMTIADNQVQLQLPKGETEDILYGYVDSWITELQLFIDGNYRCDYAAWLSYKVFAAGYGNQPHTVTLTNYTGTEQEIFPYFYFLDTDVFQAVIEELRGKEIDTQVFEEGYVKGTYEAGEDGCLLLSVPYDDGWRAFVNGQEVSLQDGVNALSVLPVTKGTNEIELKYQIPGLKTGFALSAAGFLLFMIVCYGENIWKRKRKEHD